MKDKHIYKYLIRCCWKKGVGVEVVDVVGGACPVLPLQFTMLTEAARRCQGQSFLLDNTCETLGKTVLS